MVVVGGTTDDSDATGALEIYDTETEKWVLRKDLRMSQPRHSFCAVPGNLYTHFYQNQKYINLRNANRIIRFKTHNTRVLSYA